MRKKYEFDERQLLLRGNVFQHTTVLLFVLLFANGVLKIDDIHWAPGFYENMLILWAGLDFALIEYILRDITQKNSRQNWLYGLEGIFGLILLAISMTHVIDGDPLVRDGALTEEGAHMAFAGFMVLVGVVFVVKRLWDRCKEPAGDEA